MDCACSSERVLWVVQPDLNLYEGPVRPHISDKAWGAATTHTPPPATLRFEEASRDAHATYFERTPPSRSAAQPAWVADDRKPASVPFGDAWAALPAPAFQEGGAPIHLEADGSTRAAGTCAPPPPPRCFIVWCTAEERVDLVGSHGRWRRPCLQTTPDVTT